MQIVAGVISSIIFASATTSMIYKAWITKDLHSYSVSQFVLNNIGNALHWFYIASLPFGPVWLLHAFYTFSMLLMLVWMIMYRRTPPVEFTSATRSILLQTREIAVLLPCSL